MIKLELNLICESFRFSLRIGFFLLSNYIFLRDRMIWDNVRKRGAVPIRITGYFLLHSVSVRVEEQRYIFACRFCFNNIQNSEYIMLSLEFGICAGPRTSRKQAALRWRSGGRAESQQNTHKNYMQCLWQFCVFVRSCVPQTHRNPFGISHIWIVMIIIFVS